MKWGDCDSAEDDVAAFVSSRNVNVRFHSSRRWRQAQQGKRARAVVQQRYPRKSSDSNYGAVMGSSFKRFVTFYITNFPP